MQTATANQKVKITNLPDKFRYYNQIDNKYRIKLMSDTELAKGACMIFNKQLAGSSDTHSLESPMFGQTKSSCCQICGQTKECTVSHYGLIALPYPILTNLMVEDHFVRLIQILCPCCSNVPIYNAKDALQRKPSERFDFLQNEVNRTKKNTVSTCPYCKQRFEFIRVEGSYPNQRFIINQESANKKVQLNPLFIYTMLCSISDQTVEYLGFNNQTYNPRNFMTKYIVIVPNKLRIKTLESASSSVTSTYAKICSQIIPELQKYQKTTIGMKKIIEQTEQGDKFNKIYDDLCAYYGLFLDMTKPTTRDACLACINHRDKKHLDESSSMVGRLKGKESSYFERGVIATRHSVSARTVLGGASDLRAYEIGFPEKYCNKMGCLVPVYKENLTTMRQFVAQMSKINKHDYSKCKAIRCVKAGTEEKTEIKADNATLIAANLQPGDKIFVSLLPGQLIMHCRFPSLREESWATHQIVPIKHSVQTIPNAACKYKNADFDGDETGIYVNHGWYTDPESLLCNSIHKQLLDYANGQLGIAPDCDSKFEIPRFNSSFELGVKELHDPVSDLVINRISCWPPRNIVDVANEYLDIITGHKDNRFPKIEKINYRDSKTVVVNNVFDKEKCNLGNSTFMIYLAVSIGSERTLWYMDALIQSGYNSAKYEPITLGREIRFPTLECKKSVLDYHEKIYQQMKVIEQSDLSDYQKDVKQSTMSEQQKLIILPQILESGKGSNLDKIGLLNKFINELYKSIVNYDAIIIDGKRIQNTLADHSRVCCSFPKFSTDPCAYGYIKHGYLSSQISPIETFYDSMSQRKSMYIKGNGVADQGYLMKRFIMAFGSSVIDCNGGVIYNNRYVAPCYGILSSNPRNAFKTPLIDIGLPREEFNKKYGNENLLDCYDEITAVRERYKTITDYINGNVIKDFFYAGYDFEQYLSNTKAGETPIEIVDELVENMKCMFSPPGMKQRYNLLNFKFMEYYIRIKLHSVKIDRETAVNLYYHYLDSFVDSGEAVGMKAAIAISQALTQESLDAIHHASGGSVNTSRLVIQKGKERFDELLASSNNEKPIVTLGFYDPTEENVKKFAMEQETVYFKNIWTKLAVIMRNNIPQVIKDLHPKIDFDKIDINKSFVKMTWNMNVLGDHNIKLSELINTLKEKFDKISFITGYLVNSNEFLAYIYFYPNIQKIDIDNYIQTWKSTAKDNVIHGQFLINCFVTKNKNTDEWIVQANEINNKCLAFEQILLDPRIDVAKCHTTNAKDVNLDLFGVFESSARLQEELVYCSTELSSVGGLLNRHQKVIAQGCLTTAQYFFAVAYSAAKVEGDYLRRIYFEQPSRFIHKAIEEGNWLGVDDTTAAQYWGDIPKVGSGYSKVLLFKNEAEGKIPE